MAYETAGPEAGSPLLLVHGWPDDASTWNGVVPFLAGSGYRLFIPTLRGFGTTRFRETNARRTGNSAVLAHDMIELLDALGVERFAVAGHDWGSNTAEALAVGWPDRVTRLAMLSTPPRLGGMPTPPFWHAQRQWYHWFMATERGAKAVADDRRGFARCHWENWSPKGWFSDETFDRVARSFDNPDWVAVTLHSYRSRWGETDPDAGSAWLEDKIRTTPTLSLPTIYVQGEMDGVNPPETSADVAAKFAGPFERIILAGVGHFPQRETPAKVADVLARHFR
jgi:pimeloyl-ACP methyl ester carboxylesterase